MKRISLQYKKSVSYAKLANSHISDTKFAKPEIINHYEFLVDYSLIDHTLILQAYMHLFLDAMAGCCYIYDCVYCNSKVRAASNTSFPIKVIEKVKSFIWTFFEINFSSFWLTLLATNSYVQHLLLRRLAAITQGIIQMLSNFLKIWGPG